MSDPTDPDPAAPEAIAGAESLFSGQWGNLAIDGKELAVWRRADGRCVLRETSVHDASTSHRCEWLTEERAQVEIEAFRTAAAAEDERLARAQAAEPAPSASDAAMFVGAVLGMLAFLALVAYVISRRI